MCNFCKDTEVRLWDGRLSRKWLDETEAEWRERMEAQDALEAFWADHKQSVPLPRRAIRDAIRRH
jgi:hypothetical protein